MNRPLILPLASLLALAFSASAVLAEDAVIVDDTLDTTSATDGSQTPGGYESNDLGVTATLPDKEDTFKTCHVALDDSTLQGKFDPSGKSWQITFQIFGGNWGDGEGNTLVIDDMKIRRKSGK